MSEKVVTKISVANPTGLGLFGLAMVTFVAASQKLGITTGLSFVIVYAMFLGATAQLIASILDFLHENIWGATVFGAYAFFWYAVGTCWLMTGAPRGSQCLSLEEGRAIRECARLSRPRRWGHPRERTQWRRGSLERRR